MPLGRKLLVLCTRGKETQCELTEVGVNLTRMGSKVGAEAPKHVQAFFFPTVASAFSPSATSLGTSCALLTRCSISAKMLICKLDELFLKTCFKHLILLLF